MATNDLRKAVRAAIVLALTGDGTLQGIFGGPVAVAYRPTRKLVGLPIIAFFDDGKKVDPIVPLYDRSLQVDVFVKSDLDLAEDIAHRVVALLDYPTRLSVGAGQGGLVLPGNEGFVAHLMLETDRDASIEDADLIRKTMTFGMMAYSFNSAQ